MTAPATVGEKRARILEAAVRVFAEKGFYNARVSEIARLAGVADGTIYLYFKSKDDVLISLFEERMEFVLENARTAAGTAGTPAEKLRRIIELHLELVRNNPELAEVLTVELRQSSKFLKEYKPSKFAELLKLIAGTIEAGQADGSMRCGLNPPVAARAIFGALDELVLAWVLDPARTAKVERRAAKGAKGKALATAPHAPIDLKSAGEALADLFIEGLRDRPAAQKAATPDAAGNVNSKRRAS